MTGIELQAIREKELHRLRIVMLSLAERVRFLAEDSIRASDLDEVVPPVRELLRMLQQDMERRDALLSRASS